MRNATLTGSESLRNLWEIMLTLVEDVVRRVDGQALHS